MTGSNTTSPVTAESKIHSATTVSNIKTLILITLEIESRQYNSWATLFKLHCKSFLVFDHIKNKPENTSSSSDTTKPSDDWERLDAIVLQLIYSTISNDLLHTIINKTATAYDAWVAIENLFHDNKSGRAIHHMHKFSNTRLDGFPNVSAYCQELKSLADQLANINAPVDDDRLVLQLIAGFNEEYDGIETILQQQEPLPLFYAACFKIIQVESRKAEQALHASKTAGSALTATTQRSVPSEPNRHDDRTGGRGRGRSGRRGRGRGPYGRGRPMQNWSNQFYNPWMPNSIYGSYPIPYGPPQQPYWAAPPCPYPSTNRTNTNTQGSGLLGPRPTQAHIAYSPTDIEQAMYTMSLQQPDPIQYMDTEATSNASHELGDYHSFSNSCMSQNIIVGNGDTIPDYKTKKLLLRCNSSGDLYPLVLGSTTSQPTALATISAQL
ncbi:uncharacterized protein LOC110892844 [Helianthus annuus]|uniref:uncharacterized protein LOC110892844 n=1 Tax=Helianthus annuus TaxID=4232 RepID=UPI000B8FCDA4|nr:uncharacterized protein LOC110892844 [Helianthus annuus]